MSVGRTDLYQTINEPRSNIKTVFTGMGIPIIKTVLSL